jgi:hypothetical protein
MAPLNTCMRRNATGDRPAIATMDAMDLLINAVKDHEKRLDAIQSGFVRRLDDLINRLEARIKQLESQKPNRRG